MILRNQMPPFFASPAFGQPQQSGPASASPQSATVTLRLPLGTLFDGRDYIFVTESNVRGYEWTERETDILLDDLMDAALGNLGGQLDNDDEPSLLAKPASMITDYELSQIVLVPGNWDSNLLGLGACYDVYDGQQRLVTLNLLLAALRDSFKCEADELCELYPNEMAGGKRAVALLATSNEIGTMLVPTKVRKEDVLRISLRKRDNILLENILRGDIESETPTQAYTTMSSRERSVLLSALSSANARILDNFTHSARRLSILSTRERLRLLDYIVERVHLLVCIPETSRIARNIVMSQNRKGLDNEPVDDFKGVVCFRYTLDEDEMYKTFDEWDVLSAAPSLGSSEEVTSVGRDIVSAACLLRASAALRTKIRSRGGDEVYDWERWLREELWRQNQRMSEEAGEPASQPWQGKDFFSASLAPASIVLYKFRSSLWEEFSFISSQATKSRKDTILAQLNFMRDMTSGVASAKEAEIVLLELLIRLENDEENAMRRLDEILSLIEAWTLWMAIEKPSPMQRHKLVFALLDLIDDEAKTLQTEGLQGLGCSLSEFEFGSAASRKIAAALLRRLDAHESIRQKKKVSQKSEVTVDFIKTDWADGERDEQANSIGNLALIAAKKTRKKKPASWSEKQQSYGREVWLLTKRVAEMDECGVADIKGRHADICDLTSNVFGLN